MSARGFGVACAVLWLAGIASAQDGAKAVEVRGTLGLQTRWTGTVKLTGDVTVPKDGTLEIAAGTTVLVAGADGAQGGWNPKLVEVHVEGEIRALGAPDRPIVWRSEAPKSLDEQQRFPRFDQVAWHGIVIHQQAAGSDVNRRSTFRYVQFQHAMSAVQVPHGSPLIEDCVFHHCLLGIEVG